jgi:hypothetical protein
VTKVKVSLPTGAEAMSVQTVVALNGGVEQSPPAGVRLCATGVPPLMLIVIDCVAGDRYAGLRFAAGDVVLGASIRIVTETIAGELGAGAAGVDDPPPPPPHAAKRIAAAPRTSASAWSLLIPVSYRSSLRER